MRGSAFIRNEFEDENMNEYLERENIIPILIIIVLVYFILQD